MLKNTKGKIVLLFFVLVFTGACSPIRGYLKRDFRDRVKTLIIAPFEGPRGMEASDYLTSCIKTELPEITVSGRLHLLKILRSIKLRLSDLRDPAIRKRLRKSISADAVMIGQVSIIRGGTVFKRFYVSKISLKIVEIKSGEILGSITYTPKKPLFLMKALSNVCKGIVEKY